MAKKDEIIEAARELVRAIKAEHPALWAQTARGWVSLHSWKGALNAYGEEFSPDSIVIEHSLAVRHALVHLEALL